MQSAMTTKQPTAKAAMKGFSAVSQLALSYGRERLRPNPWLVIPAFVFVMSSAQAPSQRPMLFGWLFLAVGFFRVLDDLLCWEHDQASGKSAAYLKASRLRLLGLASLLALALLAFTTSALSTIALAQLAAFVLVIVPVYRALYRRAWVVYVSMLKYPFLMFVVASQTGARSFAWPLLTCTFFVTREVLEESFGKRSPGAEVVIVVVLLACKSTLSFP